MALNLSEIPPQVRLPSGRYVRADRIKRDPDGTLVEVVPAADPRKAPDAVRVRPTGQARQQRIKRSTARADAAVDAMKADALVRECMDPKRRELAEYRSARGENLSNSDERAYRIAAKRAEFEARVRALRRAKRKSTSEVLADAVADVRSMRIRN